MRLDRNLDFILFESPIDPTRKDLCPLIFDKNDEINPEIVEWVKGIADIIDEEVTPIIGKILIKGSILSYQWMETSDFDILIEISNDITDEQYEVLKEEVDSRFNDKAMKVPNTKHPVQVFLHRGEYNTDNADGIYDVYKGWVKGPYNIEADFDEYMDKFRETVSSLDLETGELKRNVLDYKLLKSLPHNEIRGIKDRIRKEINEIEDNITNLVSQRSEIKNKRHESFDRDMTPEEIKKYGSKNLLPDNIIQKLLERYHYMDYIKELDKLMENGLDEDEIDELEEIFKI